MEDCRELSCHGKKIGKQGRVLGVVPPWLFKQHRSYTAVKEGMGDCGQWTDFNYITDPLRIPPLTHPHSAVPTRANRETRAQKNPEICSQSVITLTDVQMYFVWRNVADCKHFHLCFPLRTPGLHPFIDVFLFGLCKSMMQVKGTCQFSTAQVWI